ncbi:hypothetical protein BD408DRAFT_418221 [Parasitella parasitica]|nr:hypothetical protein BD408DRAFT_418221 [Parasitella parasitica]
MLYSTHHSASPQRTELQQEEAEASSILVSLANHQYSSNSAKEKTNTKLMSIHNLLESDCRDASRESSHPASPPKLLNERMQMSPENYIGHTMLPKAQMTIQHNQAHPPGQHGRTTSQLNYYHSQFNASNDYSKQYTRVKCSPKIRRNALQAYICYKTFTDIKRRRMGTAMHKHNIAPPASSPYNNNALIKPDPYASHYKQYQLASPPYHHQHYNYRSLPQQRQHNQQQQPYRATRHLQQLLSPPPPSPTQIISGQAKPPPPSSSSSSPLEDRMPSPTASKVIVDQPLTAFLYHNRPLITKTSPPPPPQQYQDQPYYRADNVPLAPPIPRRYNGSFR